MENRKVLKVLKVLVEKVAPYNPNKIRTLGKIEFMLIKQYNFPQFYYQNQDELMSDWQEKIRSRDDKTFLSILKKYKIHVSELETKTREMDNKTFFSLCCEILKQKPDGWSGCRIIALVGGGGGDYFIFQLFHKHPKSLDVELYTGDEAPNVE